jgi:hypothetical protein
LNGQPANEGIGSNRVIKKARVQLVRASISKLGRRPIPSLQRLYIGHPDGFINWLRGRGLIDGDGCFYFNKSIKRSAFAVIPWEQTNANLGFFFEM